LRWHVCGNSKTVAGRIIGVDVGGTKVAVSALEDGRHADPVSVPTETGSQAAFLDQVAAVVRDQGDAVAAGVAVPSVVDFATGTARFSVNIPLAGVPLRRELSQRLGMPVYVDNDATCAALAEAQGEADEEPPRVMVMFTVGTGVGGGIILGGQVMRGATGAAAELGHILIAADVEGGAPERSERFPQPGSLESLADGDALIALARARGFADGRAAVSAALEGDEQGIDAVRVLGERLGVGIANLMNTFDPDVVVIGGGVSAAGELLRGPAEATARRFALTGVGTRTRIRLARYGNDAGVRGAALLALQELALEPGRESDL
jgi:glucokinase